VRKSFTFCAVHISGPGAADINVQCGHSQFAVCWRAYVPSCSACYTAAVWSQHICARSAEAAWQCETTDHCAKCSV